MTTLPNKYTDGAGRERRSTVGAVADLQAKERPYKFAFYELEEELALENRRRLVAEKALMESENERHILEALLKVKPLAPNVVIVSEHEDDL